jgi:hypothetical protein
VSDENIQFNKRFIKGPINSDTEVGGKQHNLQALPSGTRPGMYPLYRRLVGRWGQFG